VIFSPYIGPFLSSLIAEYTDWRTSIWVLFAMFGLAVILVILFADETIYDRKFAAEQPTRPDSYLRDRFESLVGIRRWKATHRRSAIREFLDLGHLLTRPYFLLVLCITLRVTFAELSLPNAYIHVVDRNKRFSPSLRLSARSCWLRLLEFDYCLAIHRTYDSLCFWRAFWSHFQRLARQ